MAVWHRVWLLDHFAVDVDTERPADLSTAWKVVSTQVRDRLEDQQFRSRANARARLGVSHLLPLNGRRDAQQVHNARVQHLAAEREILAAEEQVAADDWRYYAPQAIQARVERASEVAVLAEALTIAAQQGVGALPRWRALLSQAGHNAAASCWRAEMQRALARVRGDFPAREEQADPALLRRKLDDMARGAEVE
jgi:hypothetical protein